MDLSGQTRCTMSPGVRKATGRRPSGPDACRRKFLRFFPGGFKDPTYLSWEREYKWKAHLRWAELLNASSMRTLMRRGAHDEIARYAVAIESRTNLLFSFEKMALRDAVRMPDR